MHAKLVIVIATWGPGPTARLGITASKKVGNSVARNWAKRRIREAFRRKRLTLPPRLDVVVVARSEIMGADYAAIAEDLARALVRAVRQLEVGGTRRRRPPGRRPGRGGRRGRSPQRG